MSTNLVAHVESEYETPSLAGPFVVYEPPVLIDVADAVSCNSNCYTGGFSPDGGGS